MARPRCYILPDSEAGVYHCISRVVDRRMVLGPEEKEAFVEMMRAFEALHQVQILTFCVMSNHFHLLMRVPQRPAGFDPDFDTVHGLWSAAVGKAWSATVDAQHAIFRRTGSEVALEEWRQAVVSRMFSLSHFMKGLKQRFTQWYNRKQGRTGTLWESRFKSLIVEDEGRALRTIGTYIDLNPVRAGIVEDPGDYRWCGYAEAMLGKPLAQEGLRRAVFAIRDGYLFESAGVGRLGMTSADKRSRLQALTRYRHLLGIHGRPVTKEMPDRTVVSVRRGISERARKRLERENGVRAEILLRRVKHFSHGVVFGGRLFLEKWFEEHRGWLRGRSSTDRKTGARSTGHEELRGMFTLRKLRVEA
jgi:putative transposase